MKGGGTGQDGVRKFGGRSKNTEVIIAATRPCQGILPLSIRVATPPPSVLASSLLYWPCSAIWASGLNVELEAAWNPHPRRAVASF